VKLLTKTGLNFISASIFFFLFGSLGGYYFIRYAVNKMFNNELLEAQRQIELHDTPSLTYADVQVDTLQMVIPTTDPVFSDTVMQRSAGANYEFYRKLTFYKQKQGYLLKYSIIRSSAPHDLMVMKFTLMLTVFPILFFLILYLVNRASTKYSLSVFYDTINKLKTFDVNKDNRLDLMTSDVDEFEQLKEVFNSMEKKIKEDYERLKEYTGNTSHELQTPIAIISTKLDELIQADNLTEEQVKNIAGLLETTNRLSKINQALIFLAKLDNRVYANEEDVSFNAIIRQHLEHLEPMIDDADLKVEVETQDVLTARMNPSLAHTLIQNLVKNAIRHNIPSGYIHISIEPKILVISNSGAVTSFESDQVFSRYKKYSQHPQSLGIGLSIVKRICDISNINIAYERNGSNHQFVLKFS